MTDSLKPRNSDPKCVSVGQVTSRPGTEWGHARTASTQASVIGPRESDQQSYAGRDSGDSTTSALARGPRTGEPQIHSQIFLDYIANEIPIYPVGDFLESTSQTAEFFARTGAFRVELKGGESAYPESSEMRLLIAVEQGRVSISVQKGEFRSFCRRVEPGFVFGEAPMLRMHIFGAEAIAVEPTTVFLLDSSRAEDQISCSPVLTRRWMRKISRQAECSARETRMTLFGSVESRVAALLSERADEGADVRNLTQRDMARKLGVHRETLSIALRSMRRQRLVRVKGRRVEILSQPGLARLIAPFLEEQPGSEVESEGGQP